ncbi:sulfatase-like hydrolase/transferase [Rudanella paleaurantiibacter]|uniref:Sulfatase-like hydrolase/transferase n=1 Tax=Rudanella paleaurantiibacter TaxID=2614655 RepID=A0A7J5TYV0_9BACT|nr:arylsulfatase [Rudanella paleaurantiibacter]KAB7730326.1 sulfatase-like hydrolase/transferase [Rudanella paleaurantiibacter]
MTKSIVLTFWGVLLALVGVAQQKPNIVLIYADDLGYGDLSCYGAKALRTPNIDKVAAEGLRFSRAHATAATCTPSRYTLMTGQYAWRKTGTGIAPGDAALLIPTDRATLPRLLQRAGYQTGVVGKWHLGLGPKGGPDWNGDIKPGPLEIGFNYSFLLPATGDRVPCVYVENGRIVGLDPTDPVQVSYREPVGAEPTGKDNPERLKMKHSHGHNQTIINGVGRIGYMTGGKAARWVDEDMADVLTQKATAFIQTNHKAPFFLYFSTHDIHVPRMPHSRFAGKSGMGPRGDVILQLDWCVGEVMKTLDRLGLKQNTLVIISSDNGPVIDDGYQDEAVTKLGSHRPAGPLRGGKYSAFEAGTRVPFIVRWPGQVKAGTSEALMSQVDLPASLAALVGQKPAPGEVPDSFNTLDALLGKENKGRAYVIEQALNNTLAIVRGDWKYIEPSNGPALEKNTNTELGNAPQPQLYNLNADVGELKNRAGEQPHLVDELRQLLESVRGSDRK